MGLFFTLSLQFLLVKLEFWTFQNVTVGASALTGAGGDLGKEFTLKKLRVKFRS